MFEQLKRGWDSLKRGQPGSRFQVQYDTQRRSARSGPGRALRIIAGFILLPVGVFFLAVPGPGLVVIALGAILIAREFRVAARVLDAIELRGRRTYSWAQRRWRQMKKDRRAPTR
jgi:hypothetical protein